MTKSLRIYVAGPYTGHSTEEVNDNVTRAIDVGIELIKKGHAPYIPHLTHWVEVRQKARNIGLGYAHYITLDNHWLRVCDALLFLGSSPGADKELELAKELRLPIFYSVDEVP